MNQKQSIPPFDEINNQKFLSLLDKIDTDPKVKEEIFLFLVVTIGNIFRIFKNVKIISQLDIQKSNLEVNKNLEELGDSFKNLFKNSSISFNKFLIINFKKQAKNFIENNKEIFEEVDKKYNIE